MEFAEGLHTRAGGLGEADALGFTSPREQPGKVAQDVSAEIQNPFGVHYLRSVIPG